MTQLSFTKTESVGAQFSNQTNDLQDGVVWKVYTGIILDMQALVQV